MEEDAYQTAADAPFEEETNRDNFEDDLWVYGHGVSDGDAYLESIGRFSGLHTF